MHKLFKANETKAQFWGLLRHPARKEQIWLILQLTGYKENNKQQYYKL